MAIKSEHLDNYILDIFSSIGFFILTIGPAAWHVYYKGLDLEDDEDGIDYEQAALDAEDKYATMLKNFFEAKQKKKQDSEGDSVESQAQPKKITFDDYERLMNGLEAQQKLELMEENNPKAIANK